MSFEIALQTSVYGLLTAPAIIVGGITIPVYDSAADNVDPPYIIIGDDEAIEFDTDGEIGAEVALTLHVFTGGNSDNLGRSQAKRVLAQIYSRLHRAEFSVSGYHLIGCEWQFSRVDPDPDGVTMHGVSRFRVFLRAI